MDAQTILVVMLVILSADYALDELLTFLNYRSLKNDLPSELNGIYEQERYFRSLDYNRTRTRFSFLTSALSFGAILVVLSSGFLGSLDAGLQAFIPNDSFRALALFGILYLTSDLLSLPFQLYSTFVIEERFGFNKTNARTFLTDKVKGYVLTAFVGGTVVFVLLFLVTELGKDFWIFFWIIVGTFLVILNMFYTSWIVPLFNRLAPLNDGTLKLAIEDYSRKVDFPLDQIFVMDGSKRSTKANAFFSGIGRKKKIVLFDTLIEKHEPDELVAVLAHEIGHYKKKHVYIGLGATLVQMGVMLYIMSLVIYNPAVSEAMGANGLVLHLNIIAFGLLYTPISKLTGLAMNIFSRKNEFEADAYATETYDGRALKNALMKLSVNNLSNLLPHRWYVFFHYSHPPLLERLAAIDNRMNP